MPDPVPTLGRIPAKKKKSVFPNKVKTWSSELVSLHLHTVRLPNKKTEGICSFQGRILSFFTPVLMQFIFSVLRIYKPVNTFFFYYF